jgi:hypothetical protein
MIVVGAALLLAIIVAFGYGHFRKQSNGEAELNIVITEVSKHYLLPTNETPALATVTDHTKLTTAFLKAAQNGDKVLIYQKNQIAIIYRPTIDRIITVAPVSINAPTSLTQ